MKPLAHVAFALLVAALQAALLRWVGGGSISLLLVVPSIVYLGLHAGNVDGAVGAAGVGYLLDLLTGSQKGLMTFLAVLLFVLVRAVSGAVDVRGKSAFALLSGAGTFVLSLLAIVLTRYTSAIEAAPGIGLVPRMLLEALLTGAVAPVLLPGLKLVDGLFRRDEPGLLR